MERREWVETLAQADANRLRSWMEIAGGALSIRVTRPPQPSLLMLTAVESSDPILFPMGEVLVTTAEVQVADARGHAIVLGLDEERALLVAALDAILQSNAPCASLILHQLRLQRAALKNRQRAAREALYLRRTEFSAATTTGRQV